MAVYTKVSHNEAEEFLKSYDDVGSIISINGIKEGVENTNYILLTSKNRYILTLYENRVLDSDIPFFIDLMLHLDKNKITCPKPIQMVDGNYTKILNGKSAAIFSFLEGKSTLNIKNEHCYLVGQTLANIHQKTSNLKINRENTLSFKYWEKLYNSIISPLDKYKKNLNKEIIEELNYLNANWPDSLPMGIIHGDLFPDNIFFKDKLLSGVIDFYFACNEYYAFDIAICINAWCFERDNAFNITKAKNMLDGYREFRDLSEEEIAFLPILCRGSALRFLLTRLIAWNVQDSASLVVPKDPIEYYNKLIFHQSVKSSEEYGLYE
tara:strand:+ start:18430 stop:19398 length:969 start_codon:yes stop_codon:yes gene_type:complete